MSKHSFKVVEFVPISCRAILCAWGV